MSNVIKFNGVDLSTLGGISNIDNSYDTTYDVVVLKAKHDTDLNVGIVIQPKGSGAIMAQVPDGTATGGNARGEYAFDLQSSRTTSNQVASGQYSVILSGTNNLCSGGRSVILSGLSNVIQGSYCFIGSGYSHAMASTVDKSAIVGGETNQINSGDLHFIGGGRSNAINSGANYYSAICGGSLNTISEAWAFIGSGYSNNVVSDYSSIVGGDDNAISAGTHNFIGGGDTNIIGKGVGGAIAGGTSNLITSNYSAGCDYHFIGGGYLNRIYNETANLTNQYNVISGGCQGQIQNGAYCYMGSGLNNIIASYNNADTIKHCTVAGGQQNYIQQSSGYTSKYHNAILGGKNAQILNCIGSSVLNGYDNVLNGIDYSLGYGLYVQAEKFSQRAFSLGRIAKDGDAQDIITVMKGTSTDSSVAELLINSGRLLMTLETDCLWSFTLQIVANDSVNNKINGYLYHGVIKRVGTGASNITLIGTTEVSKIEEDATVGGVTISADDTNDALKIEFQGNAGNTWDVVTSVHITQHLN